MYISDPSTQNKAGVTESFELRTAGLALSLPHYESDFNNRVFSITHKIATPDTSSNTILWLVNTDTDSDYRIAVSSLIVSSEANTEWEVFTGTSHVSGGGSLTPVNTNTTSSLGLKASVYGSSVGDFIVTGGTKYYFGRQVSSAWMPIPLSWCDCEILGYNSSLGITAKTSSAANVYISLVVMSHKVHK